MLNLVSIADNVWVASQPQKFYGLEVGTRMTIIRLSDGELVLISPIQLEEGDRPLLQKLGTVRHIIAPNRFHHLYIAPTKAMFPDAMVWGVEGLEEKRPDLNLDQLLNQAGSFQGELEYLPFRGFGTVLPWRIELANETVFFHRPSRSLIITDIAFNFDEESDGLLQVGARLLGSYKILKPTILEKFGSREKAQVAESIQQVLEWDFERIILAHGGIIEHHGKEKLRAGYEWFLGYSLEAQTAR